MASLGMDGPFDLASAKIDGVVSRKSPGNYALGYVQNGTFYVRYVGRSDTDVRNRLKQWVGKTSTYKKFKFTYASSAKAAFEKECRSYHDFGGKDSLDNEVHPQRPDGTTWKCPVCSVYG